MTNYDDLDPLSQDTVNRAAQSNNSFIAPDLNLPEGIMEQAAKDAEYTSFAASKNTMQHKLNQAFIDRQNLLIENHIHPVVSLEGGVTQDKLNQMDQQIAKINSTTRLNNPILTNQQIKENVKNNFLKVSYEQQAGEAHENMLSRAVSSAVGWIEGAHYDYKKALIDAGTTLATGAAAAATGGESLVAEAAVGGVGIGGQAVADQSRQNQALRVLGLPSKDLYQTAETGFISGAVGTVGAVIAGKVVKKVAKKLITKYVNSANIAGYDSIKNNKIDLSAGGTKFKYAGDEYTFDAESGIEEGIQDNQTQMLTDHIKSLSPEFRNAMNSPDPSVRAAIQERAVKSNVMNEELDNNEYQCKFKTK